MPPTCQQNRFFIFLHKFPTKRSWFCIFMHSNERNTNHGIVVCVSEHFRLCRKWKPHFPMPNCYPLPAKTPKRNAEASSVSVTLFWLHGAILYMPQLIKTSQKRFWDVLFFRPLKSPNESAWSLCLVVVFCSVFPRCFLAEWFFSRALMPLKSLNECQVLSSFHSMFSHVLNLSFTKFYGLQPNATICKIV